VLEIEKRREHDLLCFDLPFEIESVVEKTPIFVIGQPDDLSFDLHVFFLVVEVALHESITCRTSSLRGFPHSSILAPRRKEESLEGIAVLTGQVRVIELICKRNKSREWKQGLYQKQY
jgi:hypothetical protein